MTQVALVYLFLQDLIFKNTLTLVCYLFRVLIVNEQCRSSLPYTLVCGVLRLRLYGINHSLMEVPILTDSRSVSIVSGLYIADILSFGLRKTL